MGVAVDLGQDHLFDAFRHFGIESIHAVAAGVDFSPPASGDPMVGGRGFSVVVRRDPEFPLLYNHDQGNSVSFELKDDELDSIRKELSASGIPADALTKPNTNVDRMGGRSAEGPESDGV